MAKKNSNKKFRKNEPKEFQEVVIDIRRVTRVVKGGRRLRFSCLVAIGDGKGRVGVGLGKATEVVNGIKKAVSRAKANLVTVPLTENGSIPHEVKMKYKSSRFFIMPASSGTGVIAGGSLRKILNLAGVKNVLGKSHGTNNKIVNAQAAILALKKLKPVRESNKKTEEKAVKPKKTEAKPKKATKKEEAK